MSTEDDDEIERAPRMFRERANPFAELNDDAFKLRFRLNKNTVQLLELRLRDDLQKPTKRNKPLTPMCMLLLTLRFYATGSFQMVVGDLFKVDVATACRSIHKVSACIASLKKEMIKMPTEDNLRKTQRDFYETARFPGVIGAIDCTHIPIKSPGGDNAEIFRNRHGWFSLNVQAISDAKLRCLNVVARWPGSAHDSNIFRNSRIHAELETGQIPVGILLGDSGYQCCRYLLTPVIREETAADRTYNRAHKKTRSAVERMFGVAKRRFPCLSLGLRVKVDRAAVIIVAAFVLHNIAAITLDEEPVVDNNVFVGRRIYEEIPEPPDNVANRGQNAVRAAFINNVFT